MDIYMMIPTNVHNNFIYLQAVFYKQKQSKLAELLDFNLKNDTEDMLFTLVLEATRQKVNTVHIENEGRYNIKKSV